MSNSVSNSTITSAPRPGTGTGRGEGGSNPPTGRNDRNRNNRNRNNRGNNRSEGNTENPRSVRSSNFKGATEGMNGHTFGCFDEQGDKRQYVKTIEALEQYTRKTYKFSEDFAPLFATTPSMPIVAKPIPIPKDERDETDELIFREEIKQYVIRCTALNGNLAAIWSVSIGQCTETMKAKLESSTEYEARHRASDCHWLLKSILSITLQFDQRRYGHIAIMDAHQKFLTCRQSNTQTVEDYRRQLTLWSDTIEHHGGSIVTNSSLANANDSSGRARTDAEYAEAGRQETLAMALLRGADQTRYGTLLDHLANQFASGRDEYPKDLTAAYSLLVHYKTPSNARTRPTGANNNSNNTNSGTNNNSNNPTSSPTEDTATPSSGASALTFTQGTATPVTSITVPSTTATHNPSGTVAAGTSLVQFAVMMAQASIPTIDPSWLLIDSQSTMSVFNNKNMLHNVRQSPHVIRALTNGGHQDSNMIGDYPHLGKPCTVWYNPASIANILSLADVRKLCTVTMDSSRSPSINVHRHDGTIMNFDEHPSGLYVYNSNDSNTPVAAYTFLSTVAEHKRVFSQRQVQQADLARKLYRMLGRPDEKFFRSLLQNNLILNCPVSPDDAHRALAIYGPDVATLKGKTTRATAAARAPTYLAVPLPPTVLEHHRNVTLCVDFFFVQELCFFHTISRDIGFRTVAPVTDRSFKTILHELQAAIQLYTARGFTVCDIHGDHEFECSRLALSPIHLNIVATDGHVGEVERSIRTIKERLRACVHGLPYRRLPKLLLRHMVTDVVRCLNLFPWSAGISDTLSPSTIVTGQPRPDFNSMRLELGSYVQLFDDHDPTNTPHARTLGAIALGPTGNAQGAYHFLSLASGARLSRHRWTELPIPDTAIARVEALALQDGQPLIQTRGLVVEWRPDHPIDDSEYDADYTPPPPNPNSDDFSHASTYDPIDDTELTDLALPAVDYPLDDPTEPPIPEAQGAFTDIPNDADDHVPNINDDHVPDDDDDDILDVASFTDEDEGAPNAADALDDEGAHDNDAQDEGAQDDDVAFADDEGAHNAAPPPTYNLRERRTGSTRFNDAIDQPHSTKSYYPPHAHAHQLLQHTFPAPQPSHTHNRAKFAMNFVLAHVTDGMTQDAGIKKTQMSFKEGLRRYGKDAEAALMKEFAQLEDLNVYEAVNVRSLTTEQRRSALRAINLIKEKRNGILKGRTVADGRAQRTLYDKSETASPTIASDALMLSIIIEAYEGRDVATADIAGAYLKAYMRDFVLMKFVGDTVRVLCDMNPAHQPFVVIEKGQQVLYVRLIKAIYGCVKSALLWYELFSTNLTEMGFTLNPYDQCVANCNIDGKQCTIGWYVDDTKISHEDPAVVTNIIHRLEDKFGKMTVVRGNAHVFLGMNINYNRADRTATISMRDYLTEAITESGLDITKTAATPANKDLFDITVGSEPLSPATSAVFHSVVAKLLYVSTRARMDLLLATSFLATRVSKSTQQDLTKLKRLLEHINGTLDDVYTVGADDLGRFRTWIDASYAVHPDYRSHTGGAISFGRGTIACKSTKQKLNTKSSTEAETVGASDYLPNAIWVKMFMEAQGYLVSSNVLEQDNESAIKLATNGRTSAGPKSRHIHIRYFWLKDRIKSGDITIRHCPTHQMLADFFTKPLQGSLFRRFKAVVLGQQHVDTLHDTIAESLEERVEDGRSDTNDTTVKGIDMSYADVVKIKTYVAKVTGKPYVAKYPNKMITIRSNNILSRDHSLERIQ